MAEILNAEVTNEVEQTTPQVDEFDGWDDAAPTDEWDDAEETTPKGNEEAVTETVEDTTPTTEVSDNAEPSEEEPTEAPTETYQFLDTKYNGEIRQYDLAKAEDKDEAIRLIQKGRNYDKVVNERDNLKSAEAELKFIKESLESIKGDFGTGYDLLDDALADVLVRSEAENGRTLSKPEALKRVVANRESAFKEATPPDNKAIKQKSIEEFAKAYPKLKPDEIPQSVWMEFEDTSDLLTAYRSYERSQEKTAFADLQKQLETVTAELNQMKQNEKNRTRSTGSQKSAGNAPLADPDFDGWNDTL